MRYSVLASGSSGNASLLQSGGFGVLIDVGVGPRQLAARLESVGASWQSVHAVLLTHVHGDHWNERTFFQLLRRGIPVYCHGEHNERLRAASTSFGCLHAEGLVRSYEPWMELILGADLRCRPIPVSHDARPTHGFRFEGPPDFLGHSWVFGYAADLGMWDAELVRTFADVDALALEFNHDVDLEMSSGRPPDLIARVLGDAGHLSNAQAADMVRAILAESEPGRLRHLIQLHLSGKCNRPRLARAAAEQALAGHALRIHVARQHRSGPSITFGLPRLYRVSRRRPARAARQVGSYDYQPCFPGWEV